MAALEPDAMENFFNGIDNRHTLRAYLWGLYHYKKFCGIYDGDDLLKGDINKRFSDYNKTLDTLSSQSRRICRSAVRRFYAVNGRPLDNKT